MKIDERELLSILKVLMEDEFVANVREEENECIVAFESGEKFSVQVKKIR